MRFIRSKVPPRAEAIEALRSLEDYLQAHAGQLEGIITRQHITDDFDVQITLRRNGEIEVMQRHPEEK